MGSSAVNEWIKVASESAITVINTMALVFIVIGAVEDFVAGLRAMVFSRRGHERRDIWLRFAR